MGTLKKASMNITSVLLAAMLFAGMTTSVASGSQESDTGRYTHQILATMPATTDGASLVDGVAVDDGVAVAVDATCEGTLVIPEDTTAIEGEWTSQSITSLQLPATLSKIDLTAFEELAALESVEVAKANPYYASYQGALYTPNLEVLLFVPAALEGTLYIPTQCKAVVPGALAQAAKLTAVSVASEEDSVSCMDELAASRVSSNVNADESITQTNVLEQTNVRDYSTGEKVTVAQVIADRFEDVLTANGPFLLAGSTVVGIVGDSGASVAVPQGVQTIAQGAAPNHAQLKTVWLPEGCIPEANSLPQGIAFTGPGAEQAAQALAQAQQPQDSDGSNQAVDQVALQNPVTSQAQPGDYTEEAGVRYTLTPAMVLEASFAQQEGDPQQSIVIESTVEMAGTIWQVAAVAENGFAGTQAQSITIGEGVRTIGAGAFKDAAQVSMIKLPSTLNAIGDGAFEGCTSLKQLALPSSARAIGARAFAGCVDLTVVAPASDTWVSPQALEGATGVRVLTPAGSSSAEAWRVALGLPVANNQVVEYALPMLNANTEVREGAEAALLAEGAAWESAPEGTSLEVRYDAKLVSVDTDTLTVRGVRIGTTQVEASLVIDSTDAADRLTLAQMPVNVTVTPNHATEVIDGIATADDPNAQEGSLSQPDFAAVEEGDTAEADSASEDAESEYDAKQNGEQSESLDAAPFDVEAIDGAFRAIFAGLQRATTETFAIYSIAEDRSSSLTFYSRGRSDIPEEGSRYDGKTVSHVYTGFISSNYTIASEVPWSEVADSIDEVEFKDQIYPVSTAFWFSGFSSMTSFLGTNLVTSATTNMKEMFNGCDRLRSIDLSMIDTASVTDMSGMFGGCSQMSEIACSSTFDTACVTDMSYMFSGCSQMSEIACSSTFNTASVTNMSGMFEGCEAIESIDLRSFDTGNVTDMSSMFSGCSNLRQLDLTSFNTSKLASMDYMFAYCGELQRIWARKSWSFEKKPSSVSAFEDSGNLMGEGHNLLPNDSSCSDADIYVNGLEYSGEKKAGMLSYLPEQDKRVWAVRSGDTRTGWTLSFYKNDEIPVAGKSYPAGQSGVTVDSFWHVLEDAPAYTDANQVPWLSYGYKCETVKFIDQIAPLNLAYWFAWYEATQIDTTNLDLSRAILMDRMFCGSSVREINFSQKNASNVTSMNEIFLDCGSLNTVNMEGMDLSSLGSMANLFSGCGELTTANIANMSLTSLETIANAFYGCEYLSSVSISNNSLSSLTDVSGMFQGCTRLTSIDMSGFDVSHVKNMSSLFKASGITVMDLSKSDTSSAEDMSDLFAGCESLTSVLLNGEFDTSGVKNMHGMFNTGSYNLKSLDVSGFNTSNVLDMSNMFSNCCEITTLDIRNFDTKNVSKMTEMFCDDLLLTRIWASETWTPAKVLANSGDKGVNMFSDCNSLIGVAHSTMPNKAPYALDASDAFVNGLAYKDNIHSVDWGEEKAGVLSYLVSEDIRAYALYSSGTRHLRFVKTDTDIVPSVGQMFGSDYGAADEAITHIFPFSIKAEFAKADNVPWLFSDVADGCTKVSFLNEVTPASLAHWFENFTHLESFIWRGTPHGGLNAANASSMEGMFCSCDRLQNIDLSGLEAPQVLSVKEMFKWTGLRTLNMSNMDLRNVVDATGFVDESDSLYSVNMSRVNLSSLTSLSKLFQGRNKLTSVLMEDLNIPKAVNVSYMFSGCTSLKELDMSKCVLNSVVDMSYTFEGCGALANINLNGNFDTSRLESIEGLFSGCTQLQSIDLSSFDTPSLKNTSCAFQGCSKLTDLNVTTLDTSNVVDMSCMFENCSMLQSLDIRSFDTANVLNMSSMFAYCEELDAIDLLNFDTSKVQNMSNMFDFCMALLVLDLSSFDTSHVSNMNEMFYDCDSLERIYASERWSISSVLSGGSADGMFGSLGQGGVHPLPNLIGVAHSDKPTMDCNSVDGYDPNNGYSCAYVNGLTYLNGNYQASGGNKMAGVLSLKVPEPERAYALIGSRENRNVDLRFVKTSDFIPNNSTYKDFYVEEAVMFSENDEFGSRETAPWYRWCDSITSVKFINEICPSSLAYWFCDFCALKSFDWRGTDEGGLNASRAISMKEMFSGCSELFNVDLSGMYAPKVTTVEDMFRYMGENGSKYSVEISMANMNLESCESLAGLFQWGEYLKIVDISGLNAKSATDMSYMFNSCLELQTVNVSGVNASSTANMSHMFEGCGSLSSVDLSKFDTSTVNDMSYMFSGCEELQNVILTGDFSTEKVENFSYMFSDCSKVFSQLDVTHFDTSSATNMSHMFFETNSSMETPLINELDVSNFVTKNVTDMSYMFSDVNVKILDLRSFDTRKVSKMEGMFEGCDSLTRVFASETWSPAAALSGDKGQRMFKDTSVQGMAHSTMPIQGVGAADATQAYVNGLTYTDDIYSSTGMEMAGLFTFIAPEGTQAYALYTGGRSAQLRFVVTDETIYNGQTYEGLLVDQAYSFGLADEFKSAAVVPWSEVSSDVKSVSFINEVTPASLAHWFENFESLTSFAWQGAEGGGLNAQKASSLERMFYNAYCLTALDLSGMKAPEATSMKEMLASTSELQSVTMANMDLRSVADITGIFDGVSLTTVDFSNMNLSSVKSLRGLFDSSRESLTDVNMSNMDISSVEDMSYLFADFTRLTAVNLNGTCISYIGIDGKPTSWTNLSHMFYSANEDAVMTSLDLSGFDTSSAIDMSSMFEGNAQLTSLNVTGLFDTSSVTNLSKMFYECRGLTNLNVSTFDTSSATDMSFMFAAINDFNSFEKLDVSNFNTSSVTNMASMFEGCSKLTELDVSGFDTSSVEDMSSMFSYCEKVREFNVSGFDTSSVKTMRRMFNETRNIKQLDLTSFDTSNVADMSNMFCVDTFSRDDIKLRRIWASERWSSASALDSQKRAGMFSGREGDSALVGVAHGTVVTCTGTDNAYVNGLSYNDQGEYDPSGTQRAGMLSYMPEKGNRAFALYTKASRTSGGCLRFVAQDDIPEIGSEYNGKIIDDLYPFGLNEDFVDPNGVPWGEDHVRMESKSIEFLNKIAPASLAYWFYGFTALSSFDSTTVAGLSNLDASRAKSLQGMLANCEMLTSVAWQNVDTRNAQSMKDFVGGANQLASIDLTGMDARSVTDIEHAFYGDDLGYLTTVNLANMNLSSVASLNSLFSRGCYQTIVLTNMNVSGATDLSYMFANCGFDGEKLTTLALTGMNTSSANNMSHMFEGCGDCSGRTFKELSLSGWDTSNVTDMSYMFRNLGGEWSTRTGDINLTLSSLDTSSATDMSSMFEGLSRQTALDLTSFNTGNVSKMSNMFNGCYRMSTIYGSKSWSLEKVLGAGGDRGTDMFYGCPEETSYDVNPLTGEAHEGMPAEKLQGNDEENFNSIRDATRAYVNGLRYTSGRPDDGGTPMPGVLSYKDSTVTISYYGNGATLNTTTFESVTVGATLNNGVYVFNAPLPISATAPNRAHYDFENWNVREGEGAGASVGSTVSNIAPGDTLVWSSTPELHLDAAWTEHGKLTLSYDTSPDTLEIVQQSVYVVPGGSGNSEWVLEDSLTLSPNSPSHNEYAFNNWAVSAGGSSTIGKTSSNKTIAATDSATYLPGATLQAGTVFSSLNVTLKAQWTKKAVPDDAVTVWIRYSKNKGDGDSLAVKQVKAAKREVDGETWYVFIDPTEHSVIDMVPTRQYYDFKDWVIGNDAGYNAISPEKNYPKNSILVAGDLINWSSSQTLHLAAAWKEHDTVTFTYDLNGGESVNSIRTQTVHAVEKDGEWVLEDSLTLRTNVPVNMGYMFNGWSVSKGGSTVMGKDPDTGTAVAATDGLVFNAGSIIPAGSRFSDFLVILSAEWLVRGPTHIVTFSYDLNGGTAPSAPAGAFASQRVDATFDHDLNVYSLHSTYTVTQYGPELKNYTFVGWVRSDNNSTIDAQHALNGAGRISSTLAEEVTLTAAWMPITPTTYAVYEPASGSSANGKLTFKFGLVGDETAPAANVYTNFASRSYDSADKLPWARVASKVGEVVFDDSLNATIPDEEGTNFVAEVLSTAHWFEGMSGLNKIEGLDRLNTNKVVNMQSMFKGCGALVSLDGVKSWDTSQVESMESMFADCSSLKSLDIGGWETPKATSLANMFAGCTSLANIDAHSLSTASATTAAGMLDRCDSLDDVVLSGAFSFNVGAAEGTMLPQHLATNVKRYTGKWEPWHIDASGNNTSQYPEASFPDTTPAGLAVSHDGLADGDIVRYVAAKLADGEDFEITLTRVDGSDPAAALESWSFGAAPNVESGFATQPGEVLTAHTNWLAGSIKWQIKIGDSYVDFAGTGVSATNADTLTFTVPAKGPDNKKLDGHIIRAVATYITEPVSSGDAQGIAAKDQQVCVKRAVTMIFDANGGYYGDDAATGTTTTIVSTTWPTGAIAFPSPDAKRDSVLDDSTGITTNYTLSGYVTEAGEAVVEGAQVPNVSSVTYTAQWTENQVQGGKYTVRLVGGEGSKFTGEGGSSDGTYVEFKDIDKDTNWTIPYGVGEKFKKAGWLTDGKWYVNETKPTDPGAEDLSYNAGDVLTVSDDVTLYARWSSAYSVTVPLKAAFRYDHKTGNTDATMVWVESNTACPIELSARSVPDEVEGSGSASHAYKIYNDSSDRSNATLNIYDIGRSPADDWNSLDNDTTKCFKLPLFGGGGASNNWVHLKDFPIDASGAPDFGKSNVEGVAPEVRETLYLHMRACANGATHIAPGSDFDTWIAAMDLEADKKYPFTKLEWKVSIPTA